MAGAAGGLLAAAAGEAAWAEPWVVTVGGRAAAGPAWEGSDETKLNASPRITIGRISPYRRFNPPDPGATFAVIDTQYVTLGPVLTFRRSRKDKDELTGLRKVDRAAEPGLFLDLWPTNWFRVHLEGRKGVTGHTGWLGDAGFDFVYTGKRWDASIGPRFGYADHRYMDRYFGVTPDEAAANAAIDQAYDPSSGSRYFGARAAVAYRISDHWRVTADAGLARLGDQAADSPIVRTLGSRNQWTGGITLDYSFDVDFNLF
ncbi:MipA/OmpV family protein [Phenylobacterium sp. LjRoot219]|uniref:MipA/OmpV family protein n=1 Tax=Phenylobacterium sp. LjRoot219 TaxID=3342283 RepID=UPI003ECC5643